MRGITAALTGLVLFTGCVSDPADPLDPGPGTDPGGEPVDPIGLPDGVAIDGDVVPPAGPAPLAVDGSYRLQSTLDVEAQALLPASAFEVLQILEGLRDRPAETLFDLAEEAGVPAVGDLRDALPGPIESRLYGWIDGQIQSITTGDGTVAQVLDTVIGVCHAEVGEIHLGSQLVLAEATATHRLDTVELAVAGHALGYDVAPYGDLLDLEATVPAVIVCAPGATTATATVGGHTFGLPYGRLAWAAMEDLVRARYGRDLRAQLGATVDCPALAAAVANRCYLGQCVGHRQQLTDICERGLDLAVAKARAEVEAARVDPIAFAAGEAALTDGEPADGVASAITGTWAATIDLGPMPRSAPATFAGTRD